MQASRPSPIDDALERESFEGLLVAVDERGRRAEAEESYYQDVLLHLLRQGPFSVVAIWALQDQQATLKAVLPSNGLLSPPAPGMVTRLLDNQVIEFPDTHVAQEGTNGSHESRLLAGSRIISREGIAVDVTLRPTAASDRLRRLLEGVAELIGVGETRLRYRAAQRRAEALDGFDRIIQQFHRGESLNETALLVATGLLDALGYDRCWVCRAVGATARVVATSAPSDVGRRQTLVRTVEALASGVIDNGRELDWTAGEPSIANGSAILRLAEEGSARRIIALPFSRPGEPITSVAVLEKFDGAVREDERTQRRMLQPHASLALARAIDLERRTWRNLWLEHGSHAWLRRGIIAGCVLLAAGFLAMPVPFDVEAEGRLMPVAMRSIFAAADGEVAAVRVHHGETVTADQSLLDLRSRELDLDRERVAGQIRELQARLAAIQVLRTQGRVSPDHPPADLSAQEEQLRLALAGAEEQGRLISLQLAQLAVKSPIAGVIDRWDLDNLNSRPVVRGQHLCDVLDVAGDWKLDLRIPDKKAAIVLAARARDAELPVRFVLRTDPRQEHRTQLAAIGERTELDEQGKLTVPAQAPLPGDTSVVRRAGATVVARIECGRRSRAVVWFHELWNTLMLWRL